MMRILMLCLVLMAFVGCSTPNAVTMTEPASATACAVDADCAVKNVGNCCGEYLQCVNVAHTPDPVGVKAACEREGRMSICGSPDIHTCRCVDNQCVSSDAARSIQ